VAFPFEMALIAGIGGGHLIGAYYDLYNLLSGIGIPAGNASPWAADPDAQPLSPRSGWMACVCSVCATARSSSMRT
jgi:hypothetical protein